MQSPAETEPVSRRLNPGLLTTDAELLSQGTLPEIGHPLWVERIGVPPDFYMAFDFGVACIHKTFPNQLALRGTLARVSRKRPISVSLSGEVLPLHPGGRFIGMPASGPLP
jgi:hypothetical protein